MNRIYRIVFNRTLGVPQVVSELASSSQGGASANSTSCIRGFVRHPLMLACAMALALAAMTPTEVRANAGNGGSGAGAGGGAGGTGNNPLGQAG